MKKAIPWLESVAGAAHLMARGFPSDRIQVEATSYDTIGNAYFAKLLHVDPAGWRRLVVITSEFHMPRTRAIFEWVFGLTPGRYELQFEATPDEGLEPYLFERRRIKEAAALNDLQQKIARIRDVATLHRWIYTEHNAYTAQGWTSRKASRPRLSRSIDDGPVRGPSTARLSQANNERQSGQWRPDRRVLRRATMRTAKRLPVEAQHRNIGEGQAHPRCKPYSEPANVHIGGAR